MKAISFPRGSEWRKWDMHVHTKDTLKNDNFTSITFDEFCIKMFQKALQNNISAIGITDYFNMDNYKKTKVFVNDIESNSSFSDEEKNKIRVIFLFPNIELRILPATDSGTLINIHCLFNPDDIFLSTLDNDFFGSLQTIDGHKMNKFGITALGRTFDNKLDPQQAYRKGIETFHLDPSKLIDLFKNKPSLKENCIVAVANSNHDGASAMQGHYKLFENEVGSLDGVRRSIYNLSNAIFSGNPNDRFFFLGEKEGVDKDAVIQSCGSLKPCIHGSDAHSEEKLFNPDKNRFCWIKADTTFEGLKQIICEPEGRVRIQANKPEEKSGYQVIESIIVDDENCKQTVLLNPNLNTIIGGRSTGKSTLLKLIAHAINSKIGISEKHIRDIAENSTIVKWQDGEENKVRDIEFFPQSHMYEIARDIEKKDELIEGIVKEKDTAAVLGDYENFCSSNRSVIQTNIDNLFELQGEQNLYKGQLKEKGDKEGLEKEIKSIESRIKEANGDNFSTEDLEFFEKTKKDILDKEQLLAQTQKDKKEMELLKDEDLFDSSFTYRLNSLSDKTSKVVRETLYRVKKKALEEWKTELTKQIEGLSRIESGLRSEILEIKNSDVFKKGETHQAQNKQYSELSERLKIERKKLDEILSIQGKIDSLEQQKAKLFLQTINKHMAYNEQINKLVEEFVLVHEDIKIVIEKVFRKDTCKSLFHDFINLQSSVNKELVDDWVNNYDTDTEQKVKGFLSRALSGSITLKAYKEMKDLAKGLLTANWFSISYKLTYQSDTFEKMSDGKKAFVILKLLLEFSDKECPILIDQPEDSLDNRAIYNELVTYLKEKKKHRQIILVTHNANIVVNADAEEVIVSNQHGEDSKNHGAIKFQYISGSIENTVPKDKGIDIVLESQGIREHACEILEGGTDAFKKRENKYAIG